MALPLLPLLGGAGSLLGGLFGSKPKGPAPRDLGSELTAIRNQMPGFADTSYGIASQYLPKYTALDTARDSMVRRSSLEDVAGLTSLFGNIQREANPETFALFGQLAQQARSGLEGGGQLSGSDLRAAQQQARGAFSARGMGLGGSSAFAELLNSDYLRRQRMQEAQQFAVQTAGFGSQLFGDPMSILGIGTQGYGAGAYASSDPTSLLGYGSDLNNTNYNAAASRANASANSRASLFGAGMNFFGSMFGGGG